MTGNELKALNLIMEDGECINIPVEFIGVLRVMQNAEEIIHSKANTSTGYVVHGFSISIDRKFNGKNKERLQDPNCIVNIRRVFNDGEKKYGVCSPITGCNSYMRNFIPNVRFKTNKHGDIFWGVYADVDMLDSMFPNEIINADDYTVFQ